MTRKDKIQTTLLVLAAIFMGAVPFVVEKPVGGEVSKSKIDTALSIAQELDGKTVDITSFVDSKITQIADEQLLQFSSKRKMMQVSPQTFSVRDIKGAYWVDEEQHPDGTASWHMVVELYAENTYRKIIRYGNDATSSSWFIPKQQELY